MTPRQAKWSNFLSQFDFKIKYRPGRLNTVIDALTRRTGNNQERKKYNWQTVIQPKHLDKPLILTATNNENQDTHNVEDITANSNKVTSNGRSEVSSQPPPSDGGSDTTENPEILILSEELPRKAL